MSSLAGLCQRKELADSWERRRSFEPGLTAHMDFRESAYDVVGDRGALLDLRLFATGEQSVPFRLASDR